MFLKVKIVYAQRGVDKREKKQVQFNKKNCGKFPKFWSFWTFELICLPPLPLLFCFFFVFFI